jgi:Tfp pilus assembly protein PilE
MKSKQQGISLLGLIIGLFILVVVALFAMKVIPSYLEYSSAKSAIQAISRDQQINTPQMVRNAFEARAQIDNITAIRPSDLEITKEGNRMAISFAYRKEVALADNVGLYIDYVANTKEQ